MAHRILNLKELNHIISFRNGRYTIDLIADSRKIIGFRYTFDYLILHAVDDNSLYIYSDKDLLKYKVIVRFDDFYTFDYILNTMYAT